MKVISYNFSRGLVLVFSFQVDSNRIYASGWILTIIANSKIKDWKKELLSICYKNTLIVR